MTFPKQFRFKAVFLLVLATVIFASLLFKLIDLQIVNGEEYSSLADDNRFFAVRSPVERGVFLDRYGDPLVYNTPRYFELASLDAIYSQKKEISREEALQKLSENDRSVGYELDREYLYPKATSQVLGYVSPVTVDELKANNRLNIEDKTGKMGLEKVFDDELRGVAGAKYYEVNALGQKQRQVDETPGRGGENISTTIDPYLSEVALRAMGDYRGAVVILDADTGEILTLISTPTYDPQALSTKYLDPEKENRRRKLVADFFTHPQKLFFDRALSGAYPPGSVFKPIVALAGLDSGAITRNKTVEDTGILKVGEYSYSNWYHTQYGRADGDISVVRALARSNDIYFYKAAEWTGPQKIADMARLLGLGKATGVELSGEALGLVPDPAWKEQELGEKWFLGNTYHLGIGQDNLLVTPIQIAQYTQAIAKLGKLCKPHLLLSENFGNGASSGASGASAGGNSSGGGGTNSGTSTGSGSLCSEVGVGEEQFQIVLEGMLNACSPGGTSSQLFPINARFRQEELSPSEQLTKGAVACKTGTAEFGGADEKGYRKTHALYTAIVGLDNKSIVREGGEGGATGEGSRSGEGSEREGDSTSTSNEVNIADNLSLAELRSRWLARVSKKGFPSKLVAVVVVESDEIKPFREGSIDAAPVVRSIVNWIYDDNFVGGGGVGNGDEVGSGDGAGSSGGVGDSGPGSSSGGSTRRESSSNSGNGADADSLAE